MQRLQTILNPIDLVHLRTILGEREDPTYSGTKRRSRVNSITMEDTFIADQAQAPFRALSQDDRERLLSDVVWQLTCIVEGSITKGKSGRGIPLENGFQLVKVRENDRPVYCVAKPAAAT